MEPLSILAIAGTASEAAKAAWKVGQSLHTFLHDVHRVDLTVSGMTAEVKALSSACALVDERLRDIVQDFDAEIKKSTVEKVKLWTCVRVQVDESRESISQLQQAFSNVRRDGSKNPNHIWQQIKLSMQAKDIGEARNRIRSHTASLQTVLQAVGIEICYLAPQKADQQLRTLLTNLEVCMGELKSLRRDRSEPNLASHANEKDMLQMCEEAASNGESLYAASVASGSLPGGPSVAERGVMVREWMRDLIAIDETIARPSPVNEVELGEDATSSTTTDNLSVKESQATGSATHPNDIPTHDTTQEIDSDEELFMEIAKEALDAARHFFEAKDYQEANAYLQEALKIVRELPAKQQNICDTWELRYMLSVCAFHTQDPADAEGDLLSVIDNSSRSGNESNEHLLQVCRVSHLLSQVYIKLGKLDQARVSCHSALQGRRRLLGKTHEEAYESAALMARIFDLQGKHHRAKIYLRLIPDAERERFADIFRSLHFTAETGLELVVPGKPSLDNSTTLPERGVVKSIQGTNTAKRPTPWDKQRSTAKNSSVSLDSPVDSAHSRTWTPDLIKDRSKRNSTMAALLSSDAAAQTENPVTASSKVHQRDVSEENGSAAQRYTPSSRIRRDAWSPDQQDPPRRYGEVTVYDFLKGEAGGIDDLEKVVVLHTTEGALHLELDSAITSKSNRGNRQKNWNGFLNVVNDGLFNGAELHRCTDKESKSGTAFKCHATSTSTGVVYATLSIDSSGRGFYCESKGPDGWYTFGNVDDEEETLIGLTGLTSKFWTKKLAARVKWCEIR